MNPEQRQEVLHQLRNGGWIAVADETGWGVLVAVVAQERLAEVKAALGTEPYILVGDDGGLNQAVVEIPGVAWDLIDLAEKPLVLRFSRPALSQPLLLDHENHLPVRRVRGGASLPILKLWRRPVAFFPLPGPVAGKVPAGAELHGLENGLTLPPAELRPFRKASDMRLGVRGEIAVLRK